MTISFKVVQNDTILLAYTPDGWGESDNLVPEKFETNDPVKKRNTFYLFERNLKGNMPPVDEYDGHEYNFQFANLKGNYWVISKDILNTKHDVLLEKNIFSLKRVYAYINQDIFPNIKKIDKFFITSNNISVFKKIDALCDESIIIGGDHHNAIPTEDFKLLIQEFPTQQELKHYAGSRITNVLGAYLHSMTDGEQKLKKYFDRKERRLDILSRESINIPHSLYKHELQKYIHLCEIFENKLEKVNASESEWQKFIKEFLLLIFPQYVSVLENVQILDSYSNQYKLKKRSIDLMLIDANGHVDILEIKKPFESCILSPGKYRDNYFPNRVLAGTIMQAEKYIFYLNSLNISGENKLTEKYKDELPSDLELKIRNPKAIILLGRSNEFNEQQLLDFEIIKRKYSNITNIISYDDLLQSLNNIINQLDKKSNQAAAGK